MLHLHPKHTGAHTHGHTHSHTHVCNLVLCPNQVFSRHQGSPSKHLSFPALDFSSFLLWLLYCLFRPLAEHGGRFRQFGVTLEGMELLLSEEHYRRSPVGEGALRASRSPPCRNRGGTGVRKDPSAWLGAGPGGGPLFPAPDLALFPETSPLPWDCFQPAGFPSWAGAFSQATLQDRDHVLGLSSQPPADGANMGFS